MRKSQNSKLTKPLLALAFLGAFVATPVAIADDFVAGKIEVLEGKTGEKFTVVHAKPIERNQALIKIENTGSDWDGKVFFHEVQEVGRGKYDYVATIDGATWRTLLVRSGGSYMEVWVKGIKDPFVVHFDKADTEKANARSIVSDYQKSVKK